jgi:ribosomal protein S12 methylthiotransferase
MNFHLISLGCPKNLTDSEDFTAKLLAKGSKLVAAPQEADIIIINTCGFLSSSIKEAKARIKEALKLKAQGVVQKVAVTGCMVERLKEAVKKEFPEIDAVFSIAAQNDIDKIIEQGGEFLKPTQNVLHIPKYKMSLTLPHSAYLKIADGCNNRCAFCAIPSIRGKYRSKPIEEIVREARIMVESGVKEFSIVAQDTTYYGVDIYGKPELVKLLKTLLKIKNLRRLRVMYAYPRRVSEELCELLGGSEKIFKYLDMPLQHISDNILKKMDRSSSKAAVLKTLEMLRKASPAIALRTNFITGFPCETKEDFKELKRFVKNFEFDNVGVFEYFREKGTPAYAMKPQIPAALKKERALELLAVQSRVVDNINKKLIGKTIEVISDTPQAGRTYKDAPDIDGIVKFTRRVKAGEIFKGKVISAEGYQRTVEPVSDY